MKYKKVLVCGMARSGCAAARLLKKNGADVTLQDLKPIQRLDISVSSFEAEGIKLIVGENPDCVQDYDLIVLSPGIPSELPFVQNALAAGIPVWGEIELAYYFCPCPVCAVTGTNGKTTTTALIGAIVKAYYKTEVVGNIGVPFSEKVELLDTDSWAVVEVSSFQLETTRCFKPKISVILNITPDHLDRHKTMERYIELKESIGKNQEPSDYMILNADDPICQKLSSKARLVYFSRQTELEEGFYLRNNCIHVRFNNEDFDLCYVSQLNILGSHNIENALAATAAGFCAGIPAKVVKEALLKFTAVEHRIEFVREHNGISFYNDSKATNTDAAIKAIEAIPSKIVLIGGGYDKQSDFGDWVKAFAGRVRQLVVLGEVAEKIIETCHAYNFYDVERVNSLKDAVDLAYGKAQPGDAVLLSPACASWDMFENFEQRGRLFKEFVMAL